MTDEDRERIERAQSQARKLGYMLWIGEAMNTAPLTHTAYAAPYPTSQVGVGRFLCHSTSAPDAAEGGLDVLRGIEERGDPWPSG